MKQQFETFNDGVISVYSLNDDNKLAIILENIRFGEENVGISRHYAALAAGQQVDKTIHIPMQRTFSVHNIVVINNDEQFDIEKIDHLKDNKPPITKLSLKLLEMHRKKELA